MVCDLGGDSEVAAFEAGELDYTPISSFDAAWVAYDENARAAASGGRLALRAVLRLRHDASAVRRRPGPAGRRAWPWTGGGSRALAGSDGSVDGGELDGAAGHPGSKRSRLPAALRSGRGAAVCWRRPAIRTATGFPETILMTFGGGFDGAILDGARARAGHHAPAGRRWVTGTSIAWRPSRRRCGRSAGSRTTRAATTSWACCWPRARRATTVAGARSEFDAAIAEAVGDTDPERGLGRLRPSGDHRPRPGARGAAGLQRRLGRCPATGCSAPPRTAWGSSGWRGWRGRMTGVAADRPRLAGIAIGALAALILQRRCLRAPVLAADVAATFGKPSATSSFTDGIDFSQPVTVDRERACGSSCS